MSAPAVSPEATYEQVGECWVGYARGLRTMLKRSREWAAIDVENDRFVCAAWPECRHRDADECSRARRRTLPRWRADD